MRHPFRHPRRSHTSRMPDAPQIPKEPQTTHAYAPAPAEHLRLVPPAGPIRSAPRTISKGRDSLKRGQQYLPQGGAPTQHASGQATNQHPLRLKYIRTTAQAGTREPSRPVCKTQPDRQCPLSPVRPQEAKKNMAKILHLRGLKSLPPLCAWRNSKDGRTTPPDAHRKIFSRKPFRSATIVRRHWLQAGARAPSAPIQAGHHCKHEQSRPRNSSDLSRQRQNGATCEWHPKSLKRTERGKPAPPTQRHSQVTRIESHNKRSPLHTRTHWSKGTASFASSFISTTSASTNSFPVARNACNARPRLSSSIAPCRTSIFCAS